jgi:hypothetical protein
VNYSNLVGILKFVIFFCALRLRRRCEYTGEEWGVIFIFIKSPLLDEIRGENSDAIRENLLGNFPIFLLKISFTKKLLETSGILNNFHEMLHRMTENYMSW